MTDPVVIPRHDSQGASFRWLVHIPLVAVVYYATARLGLLLAFQHTNASPVWPPSGLALAAMLAWGPGIWPGIFLGALLANVAEFMTVAAAPPWLLFLVSIVIGIGNTLEALVGRWLLARWVGDRSPFDRAQDVMRFVAVALLMALVSPAIGPLAIISAGVAPPALFGTMWLTWWLGDATGVLVLTPCLWLWSRPIRLRWPPPRGVEAMALIIGVVVVGRIAFGAWLPPTAHYPLAFLMLPMLLWAALRFGPRAAATTLMGVAGMAIWDTLRGVGMFVRPTVNESLLLLQAWVGVWTMTVLVLAAVLHERGRAADALQRLTETLESRVTERAQEVARAQQRIRQMADIVEASDDAIISKALDGTIASWNRGAERIFGYAAHEVVGHPIAMLMLPGRPDETPGILRRIRQGISVRHYETVRRRKDGQVVEISMSVAPIRQADGAVMGAAIVMADITERKRLEREVLAIGEREQQRIGQDLHDGLGQHLLGIALMGKHLQRALEGRGQPEAAEAAQIADLVNQAIPQIRELAEGAYPSELQTEGLASALRQLAAKTERLTGVSCRVEADDDLPSPETDAALHLYRIAQEAVSNAIRHGQAGHIIIRWAPAGSRMALTIQDDGIGFSHDVEPSKGLGLRIMSYRAGMIGAALEVRPAPSGGTVVECLTPMPMRAAVR
ncbi:MAG: MASE1 domain-containing protein [Candidatus Omnitrophica bacterium]|nr:MASE1 domain-containing protein [Candidatus Omnitrophota bacterium]